MSSSFAIINLSSRLGPCGEGRSRGPDGRHVVGMRRWRYRQECSEIASADVEVAVLPGHRGDVVCQRRCEVAGSVWRSGVSGWRAHGLARPAGDAEPVPSDGPLPEWTGGSASRYREAQFRGFREKCRITGKKYFVPYRSQAKMVMGNPSKNPYSKSDSR